jgi:IS30 family transposase
MAKTYKHITRDMRCEIHALKKIGMTHAKIAEQVGVDQSSISREIKRNTGERAYRPDQADRLAQERRSAASTRKKKLTPYPLINLR